MASVFTPCGNTHYSHSGIPLNQHLSVVDQVDVFLSDHTDNCNLSLASFLGPVQISVSLIPKLSPLRNVARFLFASFQSFPRSGTWLDFCYLFLFLEGPPPLHNSYKSPNSSSVKQPLNNKRPATLYNGHFKQLQLYTSDLC